MEYNFNEKDANLNFFIEYLKQEEDEINTRLGPYFERLNAREKACMNLYGCAAPWEKELLKKQVLIYNLRVNAEKSTNIENLEDKIKKEIETTKSPEEKKDRISQLNCIINYLDMVKEEQTTDNLNRRKK